MPCKCPSIKQLSSAEMQALRDRLAPSAKGDESEPYKTTTNFDNKPTAFAPPHEA